MTSEFVKLAAAASHDEGQRATDAIGKRAKLSDVPVDPLAAAAAGCELEGDDLDLGALSDEVSPSGIVVQGAAVDVQGGR
jgi:hypothetical protein